MEASGYSGDRALKEMVRKFRILVSVCCFLQPRAKSSKSDQLSPEREGKAALPKLEPAVQVDGQSHHRDPSRPGKPTASVTTYVVINFKRR